MQQDKTNVLIVEDNEDDFELVRTYLSQVETGSYKVAWAANYDDGFAAITGREQDVCLIDYRLGSRSGVDLIRAAGELVFQPPIVVLTGYCDHEIDMEAMEAGAPVYLDKGEITPSLLDRSIRYAIEHQRNLRRAQAVNDKLKAAMAARLELQEQLVETSRYAGMAEVATGVLHNVGNVLNSVNVSASLLMDRLHQSQISVLKKASDVISQHKAELPSFLTDDERGRHFPRLLEQLTASLIADRDTQLDELRLLIQKIEHIKEIVRMQQMYTRVGGATESVVLTDLAEDALKINEAGMLRHRIKVVRQYTPITRITTEKHKVVQILINLISNAKYALSASKLVEKTVTLSVGADDEFARVEVIDNGIGIASENLTKIFSHGFTTREEGHGFGLHSSANAAQELGGSLSVHSDGPGRGAAFTLRLPLHN